MMRRRILILSCLLTACFMLQAQKERVRNTDTENLYKLLKQVVSDRKVLFGMANPTTIGYASGPLNPDYESSDCKDITGDHPGFHESDFMWYEENPDFQRSDVEAMKAAWDRGGVIGYCWHLAGPRSKVFYVKKGNQISEDYDLAADILSDPDRKANPMLDWYLSKLDQFAIPVFKELGCPVVFRPFHEMTGDWFWWGKQIGAENYVRLYRLTVDYLRSQGLDNLLYCWSPDKFVDFSFYPGDDYVDILGLDIYEPGLTTVYPKEKLLENLTLICDYAAGHDKVAVWSEVGCRPTEQGISRYPEQYPDFWTTYVFDILRDNPRAGRVAWVESWYNADWKNDFSSSPYIPYKGMEKKNGKKAIQDFIKMYAYPSTLFEADIQSYKRKFNL